jgi:transposase-like protein
MANYKKTRSQTSAKRRKKKTVQKHVYSLAEQIAREGVREKFQDALEAERDEILGRGRYERLEDCSQIHYRNGYHKSRCLVCGCGSVEVRVPRLDVPYESAIVPRYNRLTEEMKALLPELYLHGLSTGDFDPALGWLLGEGAPLSPATIVRLKKKWEEEYQRWKKRRLEKEYLYIWADGIYPKGGPIDEPLCLLVVLGVKRDGTKEILALSEGYRESEESWKDVFEDIKERGVQWIGLIVGDGIKGLWKAVRRMFPRALHQRCWVHKMKNVLDKVPDKVHDEVLAHLREIYNARSQKEARELTKAFYSRYYKRYPQAVDCLRDSYNQLFTYFLFPKSHWKSIKTTNPIESLFSGVKLRTKAARRLRTRMSAVCLVFQLLNNSFRRIRRINGYTVVSKTIDEMRTQGNTHKVRKAA